MSSNDGEIRVSDRHLKIAIERIQHTSNYGSENSRREACELVLHAVTKLLENSTELFNPYIEESIFFKLCGDAFRESELFVGNQPLNEDSLEDVQRLLVLIAARTIEKTSNNKPWNRYDASVLTYFSRHAAALGVWVLGYHETISNEIRAELSVVRQAEERGEMLAAALRVEGAINPIAQRIEGWDGRLGAWKAEVDKLVQLVEDQHSKLNFIGLSLAFKKLIEERKAENVRLVVLMRNSGLALATLPVLSFFVALYYHEKISLDLRWISYALPIIAIEFLGLYFFRLFLRNYYSVKAQLLQLELRYSLCAFIEGYSKFAKETRKDSDDKILERFETLIFSGITADIQNIPSQFDGVEQLTAFIKGIKTG